MEKVIFEGNGCQVLSKEDKLYVKYDSGGSGSWMIEHEITEQEAKKITLSEQDAYEVIKIARQRVL